MPGRDGTGPGGEGALTGGGCFGYCNTESPYVGRNRSNALGRGRGGLGRGCGFGGRGFRNRPFNPAQNAHVYNNPQPVNEKQSLGNELKFLEEEISIIKNRLNELDQKDN